MKFFIDTANVDDIRKANDMGVICGVTTNPSLIAKEGRDFNEVIKEITSIVDFNESRDIFPSSRVEIILSQILSLFSDISSEDVLSTVAAIFVISATKLEFTSV